MKLLGPDNSVVFACVLRRLIGNYVFLTERAPDPAECVFQPCPASFKEDALCWIESEQVSGLFDRSSNAAPANLYIAINFLQGLSWRSLNVLLMSPQRSECLSVLFLVLSLTSEFGGGAGWTLSAVIHFFYDFIALKYTKSYIRIIHPWHIFVSHIS